MINLLLTLILRLDKISLAFKYCFFSRDFSLVDTDSCFELLTLLCQKLLFMSHSNSNVRDLYIYHSH